MVFEKTNGIISESVIDELPEVVSRARLVLRNLFRSNLL